MQQVMTTRDSERGSVSAGAEKPADKGKDGPDGARPGGGAGRETQVRGGGWARVTGRAVVVEEELLFRYVSNRQRRKEGMWYGMVWYGGGGVKAGPCVA